MSSLAKKYQTWLLFMALAALMKSCTSPATLQVTPVDAELNHTLLTGDGLDGRLFSVSQPLQYYEVSHLNSLSPRAGRAALDRYIRHQYRRADLARLQQLSVLFYRPTRFVNYRTEAYEAARDSDTGFLAVHRDALAAQLRLARVPGPGQQWQRHWVLYHEQAIVLATTDTVSIEKLLPH